jgi:uncharacterized membrane protein YgcG
MTALHGPLCVCVRACVSMYHLWSLHGLMSGGLVRTAVLRCPLSCRHAATVHATMHMPVHARTWHDVAASSRGGWPSWATTCTPPQLTIPATVEEAMPSPMTPRPTAAQGRRRSRASRRQRSLGWKPPTGWRRGRRLTQPATAVSVRRPDTCMAGAGDGGLGPSSSSSSGGSSGGGGGSGSSSSERTLAGASLRNTVTFIVPYPRHRQLPLGSSSTTTTTTMMLSLH